jgi:hypothetical protein
MSEEEKIVIEEEPAVEETEDVFNIDGLSDGEIQLAKDHGFIKEEKEDGEHEESGESKTEEDSGTEEKKPESEEKVEEKEEEHPSFDQVEEDEKLIDKYDKNAKALYWKWKTDKHKRQESQKETKELRNKLKDAVDSGVSGKKLAKIKELLNNPDTLTVESLQGVLEEDIKVEKDDSELDNAKEIQQKVAVKAQFAEKIGSAKYDNFEDISKLAKEVINEDKSGTYQKLVDDSFLNEDVDENMLVERVVNIARMSPKFKDLGNQVEPEKKEKVDRVVANSKKKLSSASVSGASGKRIISESELTADQATKLSTAQWNKLRQDTRDRLLKE